MKVMNRLKKRIPVFLCVFCMFGGESSLWAQKHLVLDLNRTISLANDSSLESFRTQNMYLSGYWEYRTFRANRLPSLTLDLTPAQYNRDITKRYDSGQDLDVYRTQQSYYAYGGLSVKQNFDLTGGTFYLESNLAYMRNFGSNFSIMWKRCRKRLRIISSLWLWRRQNIILLKKTWLLRIHCIVSGNSVTELQLSHRLIC